MAGRFTRGDAVQTPFGKGVVREVRNNGRWLVDVGGRAMVVSASELSPLTVRAQRLPSSRPPRTGPAATGHHEWDARDAGAEVDLHGMTTEEALACAEDALNEALLADAAEVRFIHGRSGGRIRAALHRRLRDISSVRGFRLDPRNAGVTIVSL
jgi:DNA mismatch repair protein MutS2